MAWLKEAAAKLDAVFQVPSKPSPASKILRSSDRDNAGRGNSAKRDMSPSVFSHSQVAWIKAGVAGALEAFGTSVENRIASVEEGVQKCENVSKALGTRMEAVEAAVTTDSEKVSALEKQVAELKAQLDSQSQPSAGSDNVSMASPLEVPVERRCLAILANLSWNATPNTIESLAKNVLGEAMVDAGSFTSVTACHPKKGSAAEVMFKDCTLLQQAKYKIKALNKLMLAQIEGVPEDKQQDKVWLDVAKTRSELKPSRIIHRAHKYLCDLELGRVDREQVEKFLDRKAIEVQKRLACYTVKGVLHWTPFAETRYSEAERDVGKNYAENA